MPLTAGKKADSRAASRSVADISGNNNGLHLPAVPAFQFSEAKEDKPALQLKSGILISNESASSESGAIFKHTVAQRLDVAVPADSKGIDAYLSEVKDLKPEDRQAMMKSPEYMRQIRNNQNLSNTHKMILTAALMEGSFQWDGVAESGSKTSFGKYFKEKERADPEERKAEHPEDDMNRSSMNCWESIMYVAYQAGVYDHDELRSFLRANETARKGFLLPEPESATVLKYRRFLSKTWRTRLEKKADDLLTAEEKLQINQELMERLRIDEPGRIIVYQQGGRDSHWAFSLGGNRVMSLNGAGKPVGIFAAGDLTNLLGDFWSNKNLEAIEETIDQDHLKYGKVPWEVDDVEDVKLEPHWDNKPDDRPRDGPKPGWLLEMEERWKKGIYKTGET